MPQSLREMSYDSAAGKTRMMNTLLGEFTSEVRTSFAQLQKMLGGDGAATHPEIEILLRKFKSITTGNNTSNDDDINDLIGIADALDEVIRVLKTAQQRKKEEEDSIIPASAPAYSSHFLHLNGTPATPKTRGEQLGMLYSQMPGVRSALVHVGVLHPTPPVVSKAEKKSRVDDAIEQQMEIIEREISAQRLKKILNKLGYEPDQLAVFLRGKGRVTKDVGVAMSTVHSNAFRILALSRGRGQK